MKYLYKALASNTSFHYIKRYENNGFYNYILSFKEIKEEYKLEHNDNHYQGILLFNNMFFSINSIKEIVDIQSFKISNITFKAREKYFTEKIELSEKTIFFFSKINKAIFFKKDSFAKVLFFKIYQHNSLPVNRINRFYNRQYIGYDDSKNSFTIKINKDSISIHHDTFNIEKELFGGFINELSKERKKFELKGVGYDFKMRPVFTIIEKESKKLYKRFAIEI